MTRFIMVLICALFAAEPILAHGQELRPILLSCKSTEGEDFNIDLFSQTEFGPMHCVHGLPIADMTACAPDGGWGLSSGSGLADVSEITSSWSYAYDHSSGKFSAYLGSDQFSAVASFGEGLEVDTSEGSRDMRIVLDRITGHGSYTSAALGSISFDCYVVERKF